MYVNVNLVILHGSLDMFYTQLMVTVQTSNYWLKPSVRKR